MRQYYYGIVLLILCVMKLSAESSVEMSSGELAKFNVTIYSEREKFPFKGLITLEGTLYDSSVLAGKYVLVNLWATWCPYCAQEKSSLQQLRAGNESFLLLTIAVGQAVRDVKAYMEEHEYGFPVVVNRENSLRESYAPRLPTSYILDREGKIKARINGNKDWGSEQAQRVLAYLTSGEERR